MFYGFDTDHEHAGVSSLVVYGIYMSRDRKKFKITPDMWGMIERSCKSAAKRAIDLNDFIEKFKKKVCCSSIQPRFMETDIDTIAMSVNRETGEMIRLNEQGKKEFWVKLLGQVDHKACLEELYRHTALIIALVRDRIEREKTLEERGVISKESDDE